AHTIYILSLSSYAALHHTQYTTHSSFFFQAEYGIRDPNVTGVQKCALPILHHRTGGHPSAAFVSGQEMERRCSLYPDFWRQPVPGNVWPVPPDRCSKLYCSSHRWYPAKVYAQCGYGIFRCDNNNGQ